jgi:hypothetical protein
MALVFGDSGLDLGQFPDLVSQRLRVGSRQRGGAATAGGRPTGDDVVTLLGGEQRPLVFGMAGLAADTA